MIRSAAKLAWMPRRDIDRAQGWLMPPALEELVDEDHPVRVAVAFVQALSPEQWAETGINLLPQRKGAPANHSRPLLSLRLYGFTLGIRSSRSLERACRERLQFIWLAGGLTPDHNTLWRFWRMHSDDLRRLLRLTVELAAELGPGRLGAAGRGRHQDPGRRLQPLDARRRTAGASRPAGDQADRGDRAAPAVR